MDHEIVDLLDAVATGVCKVHGKDSKACGAAEELATLGSATIAGVTLGTALGKGQGAVAGGVAGFLVGLWLNSLDSPASAPSR